MSAKQKATTRKKMDAQALIVEDAGSTYKVKQKHGLSEVYVIGKTEGQKKAIHTILDHDVSVLYGVPGSGKTHIAVGMGLNALLQGKVERLFLTRPYVEAGEHLGYLPGGMNNKIAPFMYPVMDICSRFIGNAATMALIEAGNIAIMPLAYMRGVTFNKTFVVADECQNMTISQMHMLFTRIGEDSKLVITGDTEQSDLYSRDGAKNGLLDCVTRLRTVEEIGFHELLEEDCVRSALVAKIDKMYRGKK
jgi:phosphate starvation-inducible PhoH-like protein